MDAGSMIDVREKELGEQQELIDAMSKIPGLLHSFLKISSKVCAFVAWISRLNCGQSLVKSSQTLLYSITIPSSASQTRKVVFDTSLRCESTVQVAKLLNDIKADKYRFRSMGKEGFNQSQEKNRLASARLLLFAALSEVGVKSTCLYLVVPKRACISKFKV